jgi:hypothetical protein
MNIAADDNMRLHLLIFKVIVSAVALRASANVVEIVNQLIRVHPQSLEFFTLKRLCFVAFQEFQAASIRPLQLVVISLCCDFENFACAFNWSAID